MSGSGDETLPTRPRADDQPTLPATSRPAAAEPAANDLLTRVTQPADAATLPADLGDDQRTRLSGEGSTGYHMDTAQPVTGGLARGTGTYTRGIRTRVNRDLPQETQHLDRKLQLSRISVLSDLVASAKTPLPKGLTQRIQNLDTEARYAVKRPLAAGGMGAVLAIDDHDFQRQAAMKIMHGKYTQHPEAVERFLAEAQVTAQLEHPNIVPIHDLGIMDDGSLYFTMKLIEGASLGKVVKLLKAGDSDATARWTLEEKILVFLKVLDGVGFANSRGVVHRDLKPDNIMLGSHGEVLVVDWGIAKVLGSADREDAFVRQVETVRQAQGGDASATLAGSAMGTLAYMPPEQAAGDLDRVGAWSDVYALGATLYELISLKRSVEGGEPASMIARIVSGGTVPFAEAAPGAPPDLVAIIAKAMHHTAELRYQTCAEFGDDLRRFLSGQAVAARERNLLERIGAWYGRNRARVLLGTGTAGLIAFAVFGTLAWLDHEKDLAVDRLLAEASDLAEQGGLANLETAAARVAEARGKDAGNPRVAELDGRIGESLDTLKRAEAAAAEARAARAKAQALLAEAQERESAGDLTGAGERLDAAWRLASDDEAIDAARGRIRALLSDQITAQQRQDAERAKRGGDELVTQARTLPAEDPALDDLLSRAEAAYALSGKDGQSATGIAEAVAALTDLRRSIAAARGEALARREGEALLAKARQALEAGDLTTARDSAAAAVERLRGEAAAADLLAAVVARQREAEALAATRAARIAAEAQAAERLAAARAEVERITAAKGSLDRAEVTLQSAGGDAERSRKAQVDLRHARQEVAEHWQLAEAAAQSAIALLKDDRETDTVRAARALLADLYVGRLQEARSQGRLAEIAAFTNLLRRYDDERYAADRDGRARLVLTGPAGLGLMLQAVAPGSDGRLEPSGDPVAITLPSEPLDLAAGRWQLRSEDLVWSGSLPAGETRLTLPALAKTDGLPTLRWVPGANGVAPFLLGEREVTHADYLAFLSDVAQAGPVLAALEVAAGRREAQGFNDRPLPLIPRLTPEGPETWELTERGGRLTGFRVGDLGSLPVTGISRDDAEAYCRWLSQRSGRHVRLPSLAEWRQAAGGDDPVRVFPWGEVFDPTFCVTAFDTPRGSAQFMPLAVASKPTDRGPFGHLDLAGNAYEWVSDRVGRIGGLAAGGSFTADQPGHFTVQATTSAEPQGVYHPIGFRILVEMTP